jgi:hypothetical protein
VGERRSVSERDAYCTGTRQASRRSSGRKEYDTRQSSQPDWERQAGVRPASRRYGWAGGHTARQAGLSQRQMYINWVERRREKGDGIAVKSGFLVSGEAEEVVAHTHGAAQVRHHQLKRNSGGASNFRDVTSLERGKMKAGGSQLSRECAYFTVPPATLAASPIPLSS